MCVNKILSEFHDGKQTPRAYLNPVAAASCRVYKNTRKKARTIFLGEMISRVLHANLTCVHTSIKDRFRIREIGAILLHAGLYHVQPSTVLINLQRPFNKLHNPEHIMNYDAYENEM